ncbi:tRNA (adenosine(37)-N6)-dimethylallyltransferase MiaA [Simkania negevensis]|uniref:tRNA dimethylallyltransferase n=1 Tax=Simkania negevensis (strain ATCC VR-1471 / DSM 27360 / Z) TaxID=331113 RepID=F8L9Q2_SIMNZ|nr:tRNA (adenosine(37)-N6)-dimethylallyltransferase MiaA [Simkania negevensis]CCB89591.1 tRNA dimethylallyltransferase [Simkania negevensis Z]
MHDGIVQHEAPDYLPYRQRNRDPHLNKRVIVIAGPTAAGKSRLAFEMAKLIDGEIISADSVQVYRGMDIGTAKVSTQEMLQIPHHLIDICDLHESFNVMQFYEQATTAMREILRRERTPIVVGGTGFYLHSLIYGPPEGPPASPEIREKLEEDMEKFGPEALYERLRQYDSEYANTINFRDRHKIIRALEIIALTGKKVSDFKGPREAKVTQEFDFRCWFLYFPTEILYPRIEMRCDEMIAQGFIEEVEGLQELLRHNITAAQAIGYRQCLNFLETERTDSDWERFVWEFKKASRRYAKRQFTWFRKEPLFRWVDIDIHGYQKVLELILQDYESRY